MGGRTRLARFNHLNPASQPTYGPVVRVGAGKSRAARPQVAGVRGAKLDVP
jgi:hypothetical protein